MKTAILLVEDDPMIASGLMYALESEGYEVIHCSNLQTAKEVIRQKGFSLAILDQQLPDGSGKELIELLNKEQTPLLFLTVEEDENEIVEAFEKGAKDYVTKPFRIRELLARVKRLIRDSSANEEEQGEICHIGKVKIDTSAGQVYIEGQKIELTALEYKLLLVFANNPSRLLSRSQILERIWDESGHYVEDNTLTVYIKRLREKCGEALHIETVRGMGYRVDQS